MVRYDAASRPSGALLQSLFLTKHLLVVGASLSDDNVIRLAHEVQAYRDTHQRRTHTPYGTVLDVDDDTVRASLWDRQLTWLPMAKGGGPPGRRRLEVFFDRVGMHASDRASWLLDRRFDDLLTTHADRDRAERARELFATLPAGSSTWRRLRTALIDLGAG